MKLKILKKLSNIIMVFAFVVSLAFAGVFSTKATDVTSSINPNSGTTGTNSDNSMLNFVMKVRWGNVIGDSQNVKRTNFDGSITVSEDARISLQRTLLFETNRIASDKIISKKDPVSWNSSIYGNWDGVKVIVSSPADDNVTITTTQGNVTKTAQELYNLKGQYTEDVGNGKEIVINVYPLQKNLNYFLKVFWGKINNEQEYNKQGCDVGKNETAPKKCSLPLLNADGSFEINGGGTLKLVKPLRFEKSDKIESSTPTQIKWKSSIRGKIDGILVNLKLNANKLNDNSVVTISFDNHKGENKFPKSYSIIDLYHNGYTKYAIANGYDVVFQVWKRANRQLIRVKHKPTVYMIEDGVKRPIPSEAILKSQGLSFNDVETVEQEEANTYANGDAENYADGTIVQEEGTPEVYVIENGEKKHIKDPKAFINLGYSWKNIVRVKHGILGLYRSGSPLGTNSIHPEGALIRIKGNPKVYVIKGGKRVPIPNIQLFNAYRYNWNKVLVVTENQADKFKEGKSLEYPDGSLLRAKNGKVFRINQGKKQWIRSEDDFKKAGYKSDKVLNVDDAALNDFKNGVDIVADDIED